MVGSSYGGNELRTTEFLDFVRTSSDILNRTTFRKLDLIPASCEGRAIRSSD
jgi:hypothetical protein